MLLPRWQSSDSADSRPQQATSPRLPIDAEVVNTARNPRPSLGRVGVRHLRTETRQQIRVGLPNRRKLEISCSGVGRRDRQHFAIRSESTECCIEGRSGRQRSAARNRGA